MQREQLSPRILLTPGAVLGWQKQLWTTERCTEASWDFLVLGEKAALKECPKSVLQTEGQWQRRNLGGIRKEDRGKEQKLGKYNSLPFSSVFLGHV